MPLHFCHPNTPHRKLRMPEWFVSSLMMDRALDAVVRRAKTLDRKHDIPYLAGYSKDGKTIYMTVTCRRRSVMTAGMSPLRTALAMGRAGQPLDLQLHQALGGEADHLAQQVGVGTLFQKGTKVHHLIGHRWILGSVAWFSDQTLPMIRDGHRKPLARYRATGARSLAACSAELHHQLGRDLDRQGRTHTE